MSLYVVSTLQALFYALIAYQSFDTNIACLVFLIMFNILYELGRIRDSIENK